MKNDQYYYAVTRIHNYERNFLNSQAIEAMRQADTLSACLKALREHGWSADENTPVREIIENRQEQAWSFLDELLDSSDILDFLRCENDFANIKAVIKLRYTQRTHEADELYFSKFGTLPVGTLKDSAAAGSFDALPERFAIPANEAGRVLLQTGSGQLADAVLDKACLEAIRAEADRLGGAVLRQYADMRADTANITLVVRGLKMNKSGDFFDLAMTELGSLSKPQLCEAASKGVDAVYEHLASTKYAPCLDALKGSLSHFQAQAESRLIEAISPQKNAIGGIDAIHAFAIASENELKAVRLLLSAKLNRFPAEFVSGCLRRMYV